MFGPHLSKLFPKIPRLFRTCHNKRSFSSFFFFCFWYCLLLLAFGFNPAPVSVAPLALSRLACLLHFLFRFGCPEKLYTHICRASLVFYVSVCVCVSVCARTCAQVSVSVSVCLPLKVKTLRQTYSPACSLSHSLCYVTPRSTLIRLRAVRSSTPHDVYAACAV